MERLNNDLREQKKRMDQFATIYTEMKAKQLAGSAVMIGDTRLVVHIAEGEENPEQLSKMLSEMSNVVAVIGVKEKSAKVFVSRSADVDIDCRAALKEIMKLVGGGGGGKKDTPPGAAETLRSCTTPSTRCRNCCAPCAGSDRASNYFYFFPRALRPW